MSTTHVTKQPVTLEGYQSIFKMGDYGYYKLEAHLPKEIVDELEEEREGCLEWARGKSKNPKRITVKHPPWEEVDGKKGMYKVRFTWKPADKFLPTIVDTEGTLISDENTPIYSGSKVKLAFIQKPYILPAGDIGTSVKLKSVQVISLNNGAGVTDSGDLSPEDAAKLFGTSEGFKVSDPNPVVEDTEDTETDEDF
mgnify:CR=1 FL=1|tara:strand:- start:334 stop:921 length:588 start_codon:yes stop_codon:yes gene_type:complete